MFLGSLWISIRNFDFTQNVIRNQTLIFSIVKTMIKQIHIYTQPCVINYKNKTLIAARMKKQITYKGKYSLEGLMLNLKLQYFGYLMQRTDSLDMTLMMGKIKGRRRKGQQRMRWLQGITDSMDMSLSKLRKIVIDREAQYGVVHEVAKNQTQLSN